MFFCLKASGWFEVGKVHSDTGEVTFNRIWKMWWHCLDFFFSFVARLLLINTDKNTHSQSWWSRLEAVFFSIQMLRMFFINMKPDLDDPRGPAAGANPSSLWMKRWTGNTWLSITEHGCLKKKKKKKYFRVPEPLKSKWQLISSKSTN